MKTYEITFITKEEIKENPAAKEIEALDGKVLSSNTLGQKQFAYRIKKETSGFYTTLVFEMAPEKVLELNRKINLNEDILRHVIITYKAAKIQKTKPVKLEKMPPKEIPTEEKPAKIIKETPEKIIQKPVKTAPAKKKAAPKPEANEEERLEALDKKLDELLKE